MRSLLGSKGRRYLSAIGAFFVASVGLATAQQAEPIKIGAVLSLTGAGAGAGLGQSERNGIKLAEQVINDAGGISGRPIKVLFEDDGSKPDIAKNKAESLIFGEKVVALIGATLLAQTGAVSTITNREGMVQVSFTGLGPPIELTYKSLFHLLPPQALNAKAMLEYTKSQGFQKVGVLHDTGYGQVVFNSLKTQAEAYGVNFVAVEKFEVAATDVSAQAAKVRAAAPDAVYVIASSAVPFRNARQVKITQPIISAIGSSAYDYVRGFGEFADDIAFAEFVVGEDPESHQKDFVALYKKTFNELPKNFESAGWDGMHMLARALKEAGTNDRAALAAAMRRPYDGIMASYNFGADDMTGIGLKSYTYSKLVKGNFVRLPFKAGD